MVTTLGALRPMVVLIICYLGWNKKGRWCASLHFRISWTRAAWKRKKTRCDRVFVYFDLAASFDGY